MTILGCGAEMAKLMAVSDEDVQTIEDVLKERLDMGIARPEAQRQAVAEAIAIVTNERAVVMGAIAAKIAALPAPAKTNNLEDRAAAAREKMKNAAAKIAALASKNTRANWTPEEEQQLLPLVIELFDGALELGAVTFQKAVKYVREFLIDAIGSEITNSIPFETLQGAYVHTARKYKDQGASTGKEVMQYESLAELEASAEKDDTGEKDTQNGPSIPGQQGPQALENVAPEENSGAQGGGRVRGSRSGRGAGGKPNGSGIDEPGVSGTRSGGSGSTSVRAPTPRKRGKRAGLGEGGTGTDGGRLSEERGPESVGSDLFSQPTEAVSANNIQATNFRITPELRLGKGGEAEKFRDNIAAIRTLKAIEAEGRRATSAEQSILARYVGWGGLANAFPNPETKQWKEDWKARGAELVDLLTKKEYDLARRSTLDSHYTSETIVSGMWDAARRMGFKGGLTLESSMGSGNFLGLIPQDMAGSTRFVGIEYDSLTARIAEHLYPQETVLNAGLQNVPLPDGAFDLNIGNPPFGDQSLRFQFKPEFNRVSIHNQFFLAGIDALKPGGVQMNVVSRYLLDAMDKTTRVMLAKKARLISAIRLPDTAFKENARTSVVTDIVILQRLTNAEANEMAEAFKAAAAPFKDVKSDSADVNRANRREHERLAALVPSWVDVGKVPDPLGGDPMPVNNWFIEHPELILGTLERSGKMQFKNDITVRPHAQELAELLKQAVATLPENIMQRDQAAIDASLNRHKAMSDGLRIALSGQETGSIVMTKDGTLEQVIERETPEGEYELAKRTLTAESPWSERLFQDDKGNWYTIEAKLDEAGNKLKVVKDGNVTKFNVYERKVFASESDIPSSMLLGEARYGRLVKLVKLRDLMVAQINLETEDAPTDKMEGNRALLAQAYNSFVADHGPISRNDNSALVSNMPDGALVQALELEYRKAITPKQAQKLGESVRPESAKPAPILSERVIPKYEPPTKAASPADALQISLSETGRVDLARMAALLGTTEEDVTDALFDKADKPLIFKDPESGQWVTRNDYLTGQVKKKLHAAQAAHLEKNIAELEAVQPEPWGAENVTVLLGSTFVPPKIYADFIEHVTGRPARVSFSAVTNSYAVTASGATQEKVDEFGADGITIAGMVSDILNSKAIRITKTVDKKEVFDKELTDLALVKAKQIRGEFSDWVFLDSDRRRTLVDLFNERFNTRVNRQHDGSHLTLPGKVPDAILKMRRHQMNTIWRGISERFMLIDHVVGAGKTFTAIARVMERRRMGLSRKPAIIVPNHMVEQFTADVYRLYPGAKVLAAGQKDFEKKRRRKLFAKIASGDWDVVIIPHSSFGFIGIAQETEERYLEQELAIAEQAIRDAWEESGEAEGGRRTPFNVKQAERLRDKLTARLDGIRGKDRKDRLLTFEQMGIDDLTVDEAHEFKNLFYSTRLTNVKGMGNPSGSQKAFDLYSKVRVLRESPTGTVTFMTGTPISNSAVEMFNMMRYLAADELKELGLEHFDAWRAQFVSTDPGWEPNETGRLVEVNRLGRTWSNMRSLMDLYYSFTDSVSNDDIKKAYAEDNNGEKFPIPDVMGGDRRSVVVQPTEDQIELLNQTIHDFDALPDIKDPYERNIARLKLMDRARKVSLDVRAAVRGHQGKEKGGKLEKIAEEAVRIYKKWDAEKGTQLIFLDRSVPKSRGDDKIIKDYDALIAERDKALAMDDEAELQRLADELEKFDANEIAELRAAQDGGWNAYQQIKDNLVARGIPANEIRFIQEATNDAQKQALFDAVNAGEIRILIGSTPRMGAGTNVQRRLVGLHHADVTWKPSDIEQREGRIIRQGNLFASPRMDGAINPRFIPGFEVEILAYATERTIDAKMWSLNAAKLKTINAIRNYDGSFSMDFEDEDSVSMAEMAALASGNPLLMERVKLTSEIDKLEIMKRQYQRKMWGYKGRLEDAERAIKNAPAQNETLLRRADEAQAGEELLRSSLASRSVTVEGETFKDYASAAKAVHSAIEQQQAGDQGAKVSIKVGERRLTSLNGALDAVSTELGDESPFLGELSGVEHISRTSFARELAKAATEAIPTVEAGQSKVIATGKLRGFTFEASLENRGWGRSIELALVDSQGKTVATRGSRTQASDETKFVTTSSLTNPLSRLDESVSAEQLRRWARDALAEAERAKKEIPDLQEKASKPFPQAQELAEKTDRLNEVISLLSSDVVKDRPSVTPDALILSPQEFEDRFGVAPSFSDGFAVMSPGGGAYQNQPSGTFTTREAAQAWIDSQLSGQKKDGDPGAVAFSRAAERNDTTGFYSALAREIDALPTKAAPAPGWQMAIQGMVKNGKVKADELEWSGLTDWLKLQTGKVTKEQITGYLDANGVQVQEVQSPVGESIGTQDFTKWKLPGGENYREVLLTLPSKKRRTAMEIAAGYGYGPNDPLPADVRDKISAESAMEMQRHAASQYKSGHWDQPNVLAHIRLNDRVSFDEPRRRIEARDDFFTAKVRAQLPLDVVQGGVLAAAHDDHVRKAIVAALPVDVVNALRAEKVSPEDLFGDDSVRLALLPSSDGGFKILPGLITALRRTEADVGAKVRGSLIAGLDEQVLPALRTSDFEPSVVRRLLASVGIDDGSKPGFGSAEFGGARSGATLARADGSGSKSNGADGASLIEKHEQIIAHRDRTDADGKRVLFVEEIQSDWGQSAKKDGFQQDPSVIRQLKVDLAKAEQAKRDAEVAMGVVEDLTTKPLYYNGTDEDRARIDRRISEARDAYFGVAVPNAMRARAALQDAKHSESNAVPRAPFIDKTDKWLNLALKRIITMAVEGGYDKIAFVNGEQSADRYDLSKQVDSISVYQRDGEGGDYRVSVYPKGSNQPMDGLRDRRMTANELADHVGKELADKIARGDGGRETDDGRTWFRGIDLKVGGEGMKAFYDSIVPNAVKALAKKLGGEIGQVEIDNREPGSEAWFHDLTEDDTLWQPGLTITDTMREKAAGGLPLFTRQNGSITASFGAQYGNTQPADPQALAAVDSLNDALRRYFGSNDYGVVLQPGRDGGVSRAVEEAIRVAFGKRVVPVAAAPGNRDVFNGFQIPSRPNDVFVNVNARVGFVNIAGHELWHSIERQRPDLIAWYREQSRGFYKDLPAYRDRLNALLQAGERQYTDKTALSELEADFLGDSLTDRDFLQSLADASPSKFKALLTHVGEWLNKVLGKLKGLGSAKEVTDVQALRGYLKNVLVAFAEGKDIPQAPAGVAQGVSFNRANDERAMADAAAIAAATDPFWEKERISAIRREFNDEYSNDGTVDGRQIDTETGVERDEDGDVTPAGDEEIWRRAQAAIDAATSERAGILSDLDDIDAGGTHMQAYHAAQAWLDAMGVAYREIRSAGSRYLEIHSADYVEGKETESANKSLKLRFASHQNQSRSHTSTDLNWVEGGQDAALSDMLDAALRFSQGEVGLGEKVNFSRAHSARQFSPTARAQAVKAVEYTASTIRSAWANAPEVIVAFDMGDPVVPASARRADEKQRSGGAKGAPEGFYYKGKVYLMASRLMTPQDAARVLFHEALGHHGLRGAFGKDLDNVLRQIATMRRAQVDAKVKEYGLRGVSNLDLLTAAEEVLAEMAQTTPEIGFVKRAVAAIRTWLRTHVPWFKNLALTDAEIIRSYILPARGFVERGQQVKAPRAGLPGFARSKQTDQTNTPAFKAWFGDSKVVDAEGKPLVVYHGTDAEDFSVFATESHFGTSAAANERLADRGDESARILPVYLSIERPLRVTDAEASDEATLLNAIKRGKYKDIDLNTAVRKGIVRALEDAEYDGLIYKNRMEDRGRDSWVAFRPEQIKSAIGNNGQFDPANPDIRFSRATTARDLTQKASDAVRVFTNTPGKVNWWHKTVGTQYNLAQRSPEFKRVYDAVQDFIGDVSFYATEAADLAPKILPKLDTWRDIAKSPLSADDTKAIAAPIFEGTLVWARNEAGQPVKVAQLEEEAALMSSDRKAQRLLRNDKISEGVLKMWRGLPLEQYEALIDSKYEKEMLKAGVVWSPEELKSRFGLTGEKGSDGKWTGQIGLYKEFRAATDKSLTNLAISDMLYFGGKDVAPIKEAVLEARTVVEASEMLRDYLLSLADMDPDNAESLIATANKMIDKGERAADLMARGYAPLSRFGTYTLDVVDANGERVYFGLFESRMEADRMAKQMAAEYPGGRVEQGTLSEESYKLFAGVSPETVALFGDMLGLEDNGAYQDYLKLAKSTRSAMKRLIERKGIAGFSEDAGRVLAGFVYSNARQTSQNMHTGEMVQAANDIPKGMGELKDKATQLVEYIKHPVEEAQKVRGLLFAQYIGGSVASAMVNMTQPFTMTMPWLSQFGGLSKAAKQMSAAVKDATRKTTGNPALDAALKRGEEDGTVSPQEVHDLMRQAQGKGALKSGDGTKLGNATATAQNAVSRIAFAWGKLFSTAEQFNRRVTFIAAYRTAVEQGLSNPDAFARRAIHETQGVYNKGNKPDWARGAVGSTLFTFKQYSIAYVEMLHRMATTGAPGSPERAAGRRGALYALAVLVLLSGVGGLPGADDLDDIISGLMQSLGYNFDSKAKRKAFLAEYLGDGAAQFMERGVSGIAGVPIDISGRMGLGNLIPATGLLTKKTDHTSDVAELLGPAGDLAKRAFQAGGKLIEGDVLGTHGAVATASPKAVQNLFQAADMATTGMYRDARGKKVIETSPGDALSKALGFQPNDVKRQQDATWEVKRMVDLNRITEAEIAERWAIGLFEKDADKVQAARDDLARWNADNPDSPISIKFSQILQRVRSMNQTKAERIAKTAPKELRAQVREALGQQ